MHAIDTLILMQFILIRVSYLGFSVLELLRNNFIKAQEVCLCVNYR